MGKRRRIERAVQDSLRPAPIADALDDPTSKQKTRKKKKSKEDDGGAGGLQSRAAIPEDSALAFIDELARTTLGKVWLTGDALGAGYDEFDDGVDGVIAPMPRRKVVAPTTSGLSIPSMSSEVTFSASVWRTIGRLFVWLWGIARFAARVAWSSVFERNTRRTRAARMRETLEGLGPTFVKLGQQLAMRADLLPFEYCEEFSKMLDKVPPFSSEIAIQKIERSTGERITQTFAVFDPTPIGAGSLACVYAAILKNGEKVAVKVRRPDIELTLAADLRALGWLLQLPEWLSIVRGGMTKNLRVELHRMLMEELDFGREARYTALFAREARKKYQYVTAPKVYFELSSQDVLVMEFISGVALAELLGACDRNDTVTLERLAARDIDPKIIAERMVMSFNWGMLENVLFHADPHPANIIIQPGNKIVYIDFGSCGHMSSRHKRLWLQFHRALADEDVNEMTRIAVSILEPLPPIDIESFTKDIESHYWSWLYAMKSPEAEWWEKASGVMWMKFIGIAQKYAIPMNLDTLRGLRGTFLFDTIIFRLHTELDLRVEYMRYHDDAGSRAKERVEDAIYARLFEGPAVEDYVVFEESVAMSNQMASRMQHLLDTPRHNFGAVVNKFAYGTVLMLQVVRTLTIVHVLTVILYTLYRGSTDFWAVFVEITTHPLYQVIPGTILLLAIRKMLLRFNDIDIQRG